MVYSWNIDTIYFSEFVDSFIGQNEKIADIEKQNDALKGQNEKMMADINDMKKKISEMEKRNADIEKRNATLTEVLNNQTKDKELLVSRIGTIEKELSTTEQKNNVLDNRINIIYKTLKNILDSIGSFISKNDNSSPQRKLLVENIEHAVIVLKTEECPEDTFQKFEISRSKVITSSSAGQKQFH